MSVMFHLFKREHCPSCGCLYNHYRRCTYCFYHNYLCYCSFWHRVSMTMFMILVTRYTKRLIKTESLFMAKSLAYGTMMYELVCWHLQYTINQRDFSRTIIHNVLQVVVGIGSMHGHGQLSVCYV